MSTTTYQADVIVVGGGMHGLRSLEGAFLSGCVLTGRLAARSINEQWG